MSCYIRSDGTPAENLSAGNLDHERRSPQQAIKYHCLNCVGGSLHQWQADDGKVEGPYMPWEEMRACPNKTCELWPFRLGRNPYTRRTGNLEGLRKAHQALSKAAGKAPKTRAEGQG